jgi:hypothetical protein
MIWYITFKNVIIIQFFIKDCLIILFSSFCNSELLFSFPNSTLSVIISSLIHLDTCNEKLGNHHCANFIPKSGWIHVPCLYLPELPL